MLKEKRATRMLRFLRSHGTKFLRVYRCSNVANDCKFVGRGDTTLCTYIPNYRRLCPLCGSPVVRIKSKSW